MAMRETGMGQGSLGHPFQHTVSTTFAAMPSDEQLRTARAIALHRMKEKPAIVSQDGPEQRLDHFCNLMGPPRRSLPRHHNATFHRFSRRLAYDRSIEGVNASLLGHEDPTYLPEQICEGELGHPQVVRRHPSTDDGCPWAPPASKGVSSRRTYWLIETPTPLSNLPSPTHSPHRPPHSEYYTWAQLAQEPLQNEGRLRRMLGCGGCHHISRLPPVLAGLTEDHGVQEGARKQTADQESTVLPQPPTLRRFPPSSGPAVSDLREKFKNGGVATSFTEADFLRDQKERRESQQQQQKQKDGRECNGEAGKYLRRYVQQNKKQDQVPDWRRAIPRVKQERPGPDEVFNKDFNFGPRSRDANNERSPPLSPRSSFSSLPDLCLKVRSKPPKRQRHDSSTGDVVCKPPHGRSYSAGSHVLIEMPQPDVPTPQSVYEELQSTIVHPGQLIEPPDMADCRSEYMHSSFSDFDLNDAALHIDASSSELHSEDSDYYPPVHRFSRNPTRSSHRLDPPSDRQTKLADEISAAQEAVEDYVRTTTCGLQRRLRTSRPHSPFRAIPSTTALNKPRTAESPGSRRLSRRESLRRRSYVARCESADAFLRFVRERPETRRRVRERKREREIDECVEVEDAQLFGDGDWVGGVPL
ncbi:hypothetical protein SVAN01_03761 [Stagonosporopsis vannaccii]|nr:hypothetical protein SVAN01_03761 [Stagonosporopsis vannaccii]